VLGIVHDMITLASLSDALILHSPWLFLMLPVEVLASLLGETRFASLEYSMLYTWTPQRREPDYLRLLGGSLQSAKEARIFGLGEYLAECYRRIL
jgi:ATP-binding cassette subfamily B protein